MPDTDRLRGIFTPNLVALDDRGDVDEAETARYVDWLIRKGVHGLYPNGSTGEFTRFTPAERRRICEVVVDAADGRVPVLAGAAEANVRETLAACEHYAGLGVRAVAIVAPFYFKLGPEAVYAYFAEIARHTPVPVTLYNIPLFASPIPVDVVRRLADGFDTVIGIKDSSGDVPHMIRMIAAVRPHRPDFTFLTGWDAALMPLLLVGTDGGTNASSGVVPELTRRLYELTVAGEIEPARKLQYDLVTLFDAMIGHAEFPEGFRAAVELRGFRMGRGRQPMSATQRADLTLLRRSLACLLAAHGYTDEPVAGCRAVDGIGGGDFDPLDTDRIAEIVRDVLGELS